MSQYLYIVLGKPCFGYAGSCVRLDDLEAHVICPEIGGCASYSQAVVSASTGSEKMLGTLAVVHLVSSPLESWFVTIITNYPV